ncbi:hypothetical protein ANHYDRO_01868 [Anaerococcus hydrogenalis DSM 7454]|uniref:Uncharacterized protein n=1 Tax=Anaerococcus hydrogenalis DSM 7454 TaxID=561177 RepID=B6WB87_9FIRM|nr:hypothetical protein [Anaerococcus hydrogenalis]EEB35356.1 hypothetical protein ANHYDRO_01868 [Anaerococcus hydrogenalis DSM 7454]
MKNKIKFKKESIISIVFSILLFALVNLLFYKKNARNYTNSLGL